MRIRGSHKRHVKKIVKCGMFSVVDGEPNRFVVC